jgi:hypothetical protein
MIPETKRAEILASLRVNPSAGAVMKQHRVSRNAIKRIAKQANIKLAGKRQVSAEQRAEIIAALRVNPNAVAVAAAMGWSDSTVTAIAKAAEIPLKMGGRFKVGNEPKAASAATRELSLAASAAHEAKTAAYAAHKAKAASAAKRLALALEARRAETRFSGSLHESAPGRSSARERVKKSEGCCLSKAARDEMMPAPDNPARAVGG